MKKMLTFLFVYNLVITIFIFTSVVGLSESQNDSTIYVNDNFDNNTIGWNTTHFNNIQEAINASKDGNIIAIYDGLYYENLVVNKSIKIQAESNSIIDGKNGIGINIEANNTTVKGLNFTNCSIGVRIYNSSFSVNNITLFKNNIYYNNLGILLNYSLDNTIYHNNIFDNSYQVYDNSTNNWFNLTLLNGNYWDNYNGSDNNNDLIGDEPYEIQGGDNIDEYPLIMKYDLKIYSNETIQYEFQVEEEILYRALVIALVAAIIFVLPVGYIWYRKYHKTK